MSERAKAKLQALVDAVKAVREDDVAKGFLEAVLLSTADGTGTSSYDLEHLATVARDHAEVAAEVERLEAYPPLRLVMKTGPDSIAFFERKTC